MGKDEASEEPAWTPGDDWTADDSGGDGLRWMHPSGLEVVASPDDISNSHKRRALAGQCSVALSAGLRGTFRASAWLPRHGIWRCQLDRVQ